MNETESLKCDHCDKPIFLGWIITPIINGERGPEVATLCHPCFEKKTREGIRIIDEAHAHEN